KPTHSENATRCESLLNSLLYAYWHPSPHIQLKVNQERCYENKTTPSEKYEGFRLSFCFFHIGK
ncbi:TPA: hypothetical protein ACMDUI_004774, partial [Vibrio parahaemolyticus]